MTDLVWSLVGGALGAGVGTLAGVVVRWWSHGSS